MFGSSDCEIRNLDVFIKPCWEVDVVSILSFAICTVVLFGLIALLFLVGNTRPKSGKTFLGKVC